MDNTMEKILEFDRLDDAINIFGYCDENIKVIEKEFNVKILYRGGEIRVQGEHGNIEKASGVISKLLDMSLQGDLITKQTVSYLVGLASQDTNTEDEESYYTDIICLTSRGRKIRAKTVGQKHYVNAIRNKDIVFGIGPAGTGKTFLAVAMAAMAFKSRIVNRIILTRPAVEAGEKLGFLPGDLQNKVDPYLRPLYDSLYEIMGAETYQKYLEKGMIEVAPLAYMRGRTLDDSFIILDEAQNTTNQQMKMFLTRIGVGSKAVITGDITQVDLPGDKKSGLKEVMKILNKIDGIEFIRLTEKDVVRHELVQKIIKAYDECCRNKK